MDGTAMATASAARGSQQYLVFSLCGETYAIDIRSIKEIIEYSRLTEVPMMPALVRGVIELRGAAVPVLDLAVRFGRAPTQIGRRSCIVIVELAARPGETRVVGVIVDAVNEVLDISAEDIEPPPWFGARLRSEFIAGMGKVAGKLIILLSATQVLALEELAGVVPIAGGAESGAVTQDAVCVG